MPYRNKEDDRAWHKLNMRKRRAVITCETGIVTPDVTPIEADKYEANDKAMNLLRVSIDADGQPVYDD